MKEEAFNSLIEESRGFLKNGDSIYSLLLNDPINDDFRDDPRFQEMLKKHKEVYEANEKKYGDIDL
jgi:ASC-1-like (ASCH) protein